MMTLDEAARLQELIDSGMAWHLEGAVGRAAYAAIEAGYCMLGTERHIDYWGTVVPSRTDVEPGTIGSQGYFEAKQDELEWQLACLCHGAPDCPEERP
jgi:hypothetical protein